MSARIPSLVIAVWVMLIPAVLDESHAMTVSNRVIAPIAISAAVIAFGSSTRALRLVHLPLAAWLLVSAAVLGAPAATRLVVALTAVALGIAAVPGGRVAGDYGGGWWPVIDGLREGR